MTQEQIEKAILLNKELSNIKEIKTAMQKERNRWWSFLTPDIKSRSDRGIAFPDRLYDKLEAIVEQSMTEIEKEIEEL